MAIVAAHGLPIIATIALELIDAYCGLEHVFGTFLHCARCVAVRPALANVASVKESRATLGAEILADLIDHALADLSGRGTTYIHNLTLLGRIALPYLPASACSDTILASINVDRV